VQIPVNGNPVAVQEWLVAGPFASPDLKKASTDGARRVGYLFDFLAAIGGEQNADVRPGTSVLSPDGRQIAFTANTWGAPYADLVPLFGKQANVCAYLYAEVESPVAQDVYFHVGSNDAVKVWVNGERIVAHPGDRSAGRSQNIRKVSLPPGRTPVLVKIDQAGGDWGAYVELYGAAAHQEFLARHPGRKPRTLPDDAGIATIMTTKVIHKQLSRYIGWPTITRTRSGELLVVFSGNRDAHVCPYGVTQMIRSADNGKTWSEAVVINNTPLDDRDAGILETQSGTLLVSWFTSLAFDRPNYYQTHPDWQRHADKLGPETRHYWLGNWTRRSTDHGKTWQIPVKQNVSAPHGPIELADGRLLYVGTGTRHDQKVLGVEESRDDGRTWRYIATIAIPGEESISAYWEPHVAELPDGRLLAMFRYQPQDRTKCFLRQSESQDGGTSWTTAQPTPIWGYPPHLLTLKNGWLLLVYGVRREPFSERACISRDGGESWDIDHEIILSRAGNDDLGYPASVQLDDGSILTVYYQVDKPGEKTRLMSTHWRLNNIAGKTGEDDL
jgi:hypothetical protein